MGFKAYSRRIAVNSWNRKHFDFMQKRFAKSFKPIETTTKAELTLNAGSCRFIHSTYDKKVYWKAYYLANKDAIKEKRRAYALKHCKEEQNRAKKFYEKNKVYRYFYHCVLTNIFYKIKNEGV